MWHAVAVSRPTFFADVATELGKIYFTTKFSSCPWGIRGLVGIGFGGSRGFRGVKSEFKG